MINILFNENGIGNYDIAIKSDEASTASKPLTLNIQNYAIRTLSSNTSRKKKMVIDSINHEGTGDFAASKLDLVTKSTAKITLT
jgi:hypothetical protein